MYVLVYCSSTVRQSVSKGEFDAFWNDYRSGKMNLSKPPLHLPNYLPTYLKYLSIHPVFLMV